MAESGTPEPAGGIRHVHSAEHHLFEIWEVECEKIIDVLGLSHAILRHHSILPRPFELAASASDLRHASLNAKE